MPQAGAIKRTSDDLSPFFLTVEENHYVMNFTTRWDQWQEKLLCYRQWHWLLNTKKSNTTTKK